MGQDNSKIPSKRRVDDAEKVKLLCKAENRAAVKLSASEVKTLKQLYHRLASLSPENEYIDKQTFLNYFPLEGVLAERLFVTFDKDKNNFIDYEEFLGGLALCLCGTTDEKFQLVFDLYNIDDGDGISEDELAVVLKSTLMAASAIVSPIRPNMIGDDSQNFDIDEHVRNVVKDAFEQCDTSQTGKLSPEEFRTWAERHSYILDIIFGHKSFTDKQKISENITVATMKAAEMNAVRYQPQTWMESPASLEQPPETSTGYSKATYLWSPVFPVMLKAPKARSGHTVCVYQGSLYLLGGRGSTTYKDFWKYDLALNNWSEILNSGERPSQIFGHTAVVHKGSMFVYGGEFASCETLVWNYTFASSEWQRISPTTQSRSEIPGNRRHHSAVVYENKMYIFGGIIDLRGSTNEFWSFDFADQEWNLISQTPKSSPGSRYEHSAVVYNKAMWIVGGLENYQAKSDTWRWNFEYISWTKIKSKGGPFPIHGHRVVKCGNAMIVFGGSINGEYHNMIWKFEYETQAWSLITPHGGVSPPARSAPSVIILSAFSLPLLPPQLVQSERRTVLSVPQATMVDELRPRSSPDFKYKENGSLEKRSRHWQSSDSIYQPPTTNPGVTNYSYQSSIDETEFLNTSKDAHTVRSSWEGVVLDFEGNEREQKEEKNCEGLQLKLDEQEVVNKESNTAITVELKRPTSHPKEGLCIFLVGGKYCGSHEFFAKGIDIWRCDVTKRRKRSKKVTKINVQTAGAGTTSLSDDAYRNKELSTCNENMNKASSGNVAPLHSSNSTNNKSRETCATAYAQDLVKTTEFQVKTRIDDPYPSTNDTHYGDLVVTDLSHANDHHLIENSQ